MKKGSKVLFVYFSVLIMVVGFFLPNFSYIVNASEVKPGDTLLKGATSAFTNVEDNTLYLGMEENTSSRVEVNSLNYIVEGCTVVNSSVVSATLNDDGISCTIDSLGYGKTEVLFDIKNINSGSNKIEVLSVDVEFEDYFNYYYNKIPDTMRYSQYAEQFIASELNFPEEFSTGFGEEGCYVESGSESTCKIELIYTYNYYVEGVKDYQVNTYSKLKDVIVTDYFSDNEDVIYPQNGNLYLGVGEVKAFEFDGYLDINEYFWVSSDNSVVRIDNSNNVIGNGEGVANIRLVHKETLDLFVDVIVHVENGYISKEIDDVLKKFSGTLVIDVSNDLGLYSEDIVEQSLLVENYFKKFVEGSKLEYKTMTCAEDLNDCILDFTDLSNYQDYATNIFSVQFTGINIGNLYGIHTGYEDVNFIFLDKTLKLNNISNLVTVTEEDPENEGQTITRAADILIDYDSEYLELVDEDTFEFKTLKEGYTTITLYAGDSMTSVTLCILFTEDEVNRATNLLANFTELEIPFSAEGISDKTAEDLIRGYLENELLNNDLYDYLVLIITLLPDNNFKLSATVEYDGYYLGILPIYDQFINGKFDEEGLNIYNEVEEIFSGVKDRYKLSLDQSIEAMANDKTGDDLIPYTGLDQVIPDTLDVVITPLEEYYFNWYLNAGTMFVMELYYEEVLVGRKEFFVQLDLVLDRSVLDESDEASKLTYVTSYIDNLDLGLTVTKEQENYYKLVSDLNRFYILFDQKDLIEAESVSFDALDITLNVGESYKIRSLWYPIGSTHAATRFVSSNPTAFTVDEKGVIVAKAKGYGLVRMSFGNSYKDMFVAVGYEDNEFFDEIVGNLNLNLKVSFDEYKACGDIMCVLYDRISNQINDYVDTLRAPLGTNASSGISTFAASTGEFGYEINQTENEGWELVLQVGPFISDAYPITYAFTGITMENPEIDLDINETKEIDISFSEGDKSNLRYYVQDTSVATIKKGKVTGLKNGMTKVHVYDKYNYYSFEFTVFVNKEEYIDYLNRKLDSTLVELTGVDLNGVSTNFRTAVDYQIENKLLAAGIELETLYGSYDYLNAVINQDLNSAEITLKRFESSKENKFDINIKVNGLYLPSPIVELNIGDTYEVSMHRYGEAATEDYTSVSVTPELCTINGATVTALKSGICEVNYTVNNETIKQYFYISLNDFVPYLDGILDGIVETINIQAEPYDISKYDEGDWKYVDLYNVLIRKELDLLLDGYDRVEYMLEDSAIDQNGLVNFNLYYDKTVRFPYGIKSYGASVESKEKSIKVVYQDPSSDKDEIVAKILEGVKTEYVLTTDQVLDVIVNEGDIEYKSPYLFKYSDFEKDLKEACPECTYYNNGCGATSPQNGIIYSSINAIVFRGDEALVTLNVYVQANINIDIYEIENDGYIEDSIKKHVRDAYRRYKDRHHASLYYRLRNNITEVTTVNDYEVELENLGDNLYTITIDDKTFNSYIHINILTEEEDFDYSVKVEEITLNEDKVVLTVGESFDLVASILPDNAFNKNVIWSSADNSIATVVNGKVTAMKAGSTVITVKSEDGRAQTSINVIVNPLKVKEIKVNKEILNMTAGDTFDLIAVVYPENASNKELKWSSTNTNVVTVENGKVTAIGAGSAMIRVESVDGGMAVAAINVSVIELGLPGDIDADGKINIVDLIHLRKHLAGITVLTGDYYKRADFNKDGLVNIVDLVNMRKHLAA